MAIPTHNLNLSNILSRMYSSMCAMTDCCSYLVITNEAWGNGCVRIGCFHLVFSIKAINSRNSIFGMKDMHCYTAEMGPDTSTIQADKSEFFFA